MQRRRLLRPRQDPGERQGREGGLPPLSLSLPPPPRRRRRCRGRQPHLPTLWLPLPCCVQLILSAAGNHEACADDLELMEVLEGFDGLQTMHHTAAGYLRHPLWQLARSPRRS